MKLKKIIIKELYKKFEKDKSKEIVINFLNAFNDSSPYFFVRYTTKDTNFYLFTNIKSIFFKLKKTSPENFLKIFFYDILEVRTVNIFRPSFYMTLTLINYFLFFTSSIKRKIKEKIKIFEFSTYPDQLEISYLRKKNFKIYSFDYFKNLYYPFIYFIVFKSLEYRPWS